MLENQEMQMPSKEERAKRRETEEKIWKIERGHILDVEKEIPEGSGKIRIDALAQAVSAGDTGVIVGTLKQIGNELNIIMGFPTPAFVEEMGRGEYKIGCLNGTSGKRGLLRIEDGRARLNFSYLDDTQAGSGPTMKKAVESYFELTTDGDGSCSIEIGRVD